MKHAVQPEKKRRPWVKNAAIVFLSVMLVLTFFSRTIMNVSLPEVTGQYLSGGTISRAVTGSGTVTANLAYNVQLAETRTVTDVKIAAGDTVEPGQVLFTLEPAESEELKAAEETLDQMEYDYGVALIQAVDPDYASENSQIGAIQSQLNAAIQARDKAAGQQQSYDAARAAVTSAQQTVSSLQNEIASLQAKLALTGSGDATLTGLRASLAQAQNVQASAAADLAGKEAAVTAAQGGMPVDVAAAQAALDQAQAELTRLTQVRDSLEGNEELKTAAEADVTAQQAVVAAAQSALAEAQAQAQAAQAALTDAKNQRDAAQQVLTSAQQAVQAAQQAVDDRITELTDPTLSQQLAEKQAALIPAQAKLSEAQASLGNAEPGGYEAACDTVRSLQAQLSQAAAALAEQQRADGVTAETAAFDLQSKADHIDQQKALVEKLRADGSVNEIAAQYGGTVASVSSVAGDVVGPGVTMATIHVEGKEYTLTMPVTAEQASQLSVGDQARTADYFYFGGVQATLSAIRSDPDAPGQNKLLEFTVSGDVTDGQNLSLAIDLGSQSYPLVAPKSAIRSDADGEFILAAAAESSPLGSRYVVRRVPVTVMDSDEYNAAIQTADGGNNYYVVTTSTAPLAAGDQVRLADQ